MKFTSAMPHPTLRVVFLASNFSLIALIALCLAWEMRLAPVLQGGSWLALKVLPLIAALPGIVRGRRYTFQWSSMMILLYFIEGIVRAMTDQGLSQTLACIETMLSAAFYAAAIAFVRLSRPGRP